MKSKKPLFKNNGFPFWFRLLKYLSLGSSTGILNGMPVQNVVIFGTISVPDTNDKIKFKIVTNSSQTLKCRR